MDLGGRIAAWLRVKGMSQKDLAAAIDVSPSAVTAWIKGDYAPSNKTLVAIVDALHLTMEKFYGRVPKRAAA